MVRSFIMVCWVGWEQLREMVWYGADIRKWGNGDGIDTGGRTEIKVSIPSHPISMEITRKALKITNINKGTAAHGDECGTLWASGDTQTHTLAPAELPHCNNADRYCSVWNSGASLCIDYVFAAYDPTQTFWHFPPLTGR